MIKVNKKVNNKAVSNSKNKILKYIKFLDSSTSYNNKQNKLSHKLRLLKIGLKYLLKIYQNINLITIKDSQDYKKLWLMKDMRLIQNTLFKHQK